MLEVKTEVDETSVKDFLEKKYSSPIQDFQIIKGGQHSQPFSYSFNEKSYVIRIRRNIESFKKDKSITDILTTDNPSIPLPKIYEIGIFQESDDFNLYYYINEKCEGKIGYHFSPELLESLRLPLIKLLFKIHQIDISDTTNYGIWINFEKAPYSSWKEFLIDYTQSKIDYLVDFFKDEPAEIKYIATLGKRIKNLIPYCPEDRYLIHGDYGIHNILVSDTGKITGILDWELSKFGDFVYDIAWFDYWRFHGHPTYKEDYLKFYEKQNDETIENYFERIQCYTLCEGLHMAGFYCRSGQLERYHAGKKHLLQFE